MIAAAVFYSSIPVKTAAVGGAVWKAAATGLRCAGTASDSEPLPQIELDQASFSTPSR